MASIFKRPSGTWTVEIYLDKERKTKIGLATKSQREAQRTADRIQALADSKKTGIENQDCVAWLIKVREESPKLYAKLVSIGLAQEFKEKKLHTILELKKVLISSKSIKYSTIAGYETACKTLIEFFGESFHIEEIGPEHIAHFNEWLHSDSAGSRICSALSKATIERRIRHFKSLFSMAVKLNWIDKNYFKELKSGSTANRSRHFYVSREMAIQVISNTQSKKWKLIFALGRFAGARGASELFSIKWSDIRYSSNNKPALIIFNVPKKEGSIDERRTVPMCNILECLFKDYEPESHGKDERIFPEMNATTNLSICIGKLIQQGGVDKWPESWYNLRRSFCSDLMEIGIDPKLYESVSGHSFATGMKHYQILHPERMKQGFEKIVDVLSAKFSSVDKSGDKLGDKTQ